MNDFNITKQMGGTLLLVIASLFFLHSSVLAQYSQEAFSLKCAQDGYDEAGFTNGNAINVDGNLVVTASSGAVAYSYPISNRIIDGYPLDVALNFCSSVSFSAFKDYNLADRQTGGLYSGWAKFHQNRGLWIVAAGGWAINAIATSTHFHADSASPAFNNSFNAYDDSAFPWVIDGFDFCNRMRDFNPVAAAQSNKLTDVIQILRGDGSLLKLYNAHTITPNDSDNDQRAYLYTGIYATNLANDRSYGVVEYDDVYLPDHMRAELNARADAGHQYPLRPRRLTYYPGDGTSVIFREYLTPFGFNAYIDDENRGGGAWAHPSIFYLEEIRGSTGTLVEFRRARHYPIYGNPLFESLDDKTRGRALITEFADHRISFGHHSFIVEAMGRSTKIVFDSIARSGNAGATEIMPWANAGTLTPRSLWLAGLPEGSPEPYRSFVGYVTKIVDAEDRVTTFEYEPITRTYQNFNFPHANPGAGAQTIALKNYRLKAVNEPDARYVLHYKQPMTGGNIVAGAANEREKLNDVCDSVKKYGPGGQLLTATSYEPSLNSAITCVTDAVTGQTVTTVHSYDTLDLGRMDPLMPAERHTFVWRTDRIGGGDTVVNTTNYEQGTNIPGVTTNSRWLVLLTSAGESVNGIERSYTTFSYETDTLRSYGGRKDLAGRYGMEITRSATNTHRPDDHNAVLFRDTTEYAHFPQVDTTITWDEWNWNKFASQDNFRAYRAGDSALVRGRRWEDVMYTQPLAVYDRVTLTDSLSLPPLFAVERASWRSNDHGRISGTRAVLNEDIIAGVNRIERGAVLRDSVLGADGASVLNGHYRYANGWRKLLQEKENAHGARTRYSYTHGWCAIDSFGISSCESGGYPNALVLSNDDSVRAVAMEPGAAALWYETPVATRSYVRRYEPVTLVPVTDTLEEYRELTYYGLVAGTRDPNGWLNRAEYDRNGRLETLWEPGDFPRAGALDTAFFEGTQEIPLYGETWYQRRADSLHCWKANGIAHSQVVSGPVLGTLISDTLYAHLPVTEAPPCPCTSDPLETKEGPGRRTLATCDQMLPYPVHAGYNGFYGLLPALKDSAGPLSYAARIDSMFVETVITSVDGECVHLEVKIDSVFSKTFVLNCPAGEEDPGEDPNGGSRAKEGNTGRGLMSAITPVAGGYRLRVNITSAAAQLAARPVGAAMDVRLRVKTVDGIVGFASGLTSEDLRPRIVVHGEFARVWSRSDYTLAFEHDDAALKTTETAKIDDRLHTANQYDLVAMAGATKRRASATNHFGADGRVLHTETPTHTPTGVRVDHSWSGYTGNGSRILAVDEENDSTQVEYDALGRPVKTINADGSFSTTAYRNGAPADFGITEDYHGFCTATFTTDETGTTTASFADAFGRARRDVVDTAGLKLTTRYEYDDAGRLARAINPKGDTTAYAYDAFGRVRYTAHPDMGTTSYGYDALGNLRFVQDEQQAVGLRMSFNQYDDLNRLVVTGEAVFSNEQCGTYYEDDLYGECDSSYLPRTKDVGGHDPSRTERKRDEGKHERGGRLMSGGDDPHAGRLTNRADAARLNTLPDSTIPTANSTLFMVPGTSPPTFAPIVQQILADCQLAPDPRLGETAVIYGRKLLHPVQFYRSAGSAPATLDDFENIRLHPEFVRMVVAYDSMPASAGSVFVTMPPRAQWDALAPKGRMRNQRGDEAVVAYRDRGAEPFHFAAMSYDERGRVEALIRYTENIGFDAVYYTYNAMNKVTSVRVADAFRQFTTWYGYDANGDEDSTWTRLGPFGSGLAPNGNLAALAYPPPLARSVTADYVYEHTPAGQLSSTHYPTAGMLVRYAYNHRKSLDSMTATRGATNVFRQALTYDAAGMIRAQEWQHGTGTRMRQEYTHDPADRLQRWTNGNAMPGVAHDTTRYAYDAAGNRVEARRSTSAWPETYSLEPWSANRLWARDRRDAMGGDTTTGYAYDRTGAMTWRQRTYNTSAFSNLLRADEFRYNTRGLLKRSLSTDYTTGVPPQNAPYEDWFYRYGAAGEREQKRLYATNLGDTATPYAWVYYLLGGEREQLAVYHGRQTTEPAGAPAGCGGLAGRRVYLYPVEYLTYGIGDEASIITRPTGAKEYVIADHLGSARVRVSTGGAVLGTTDYEPFGTVLARTGATMRKGYIDRETDRENGLGSFGARAYLAEEGRFGSVDPLWEKFRAHTPYNYAFNAPVMASDPSGMGVPAVLAAAGEVLGSAADVYDVVTTFADPHATTLDKGMAIGGALLGVIGPGGGYNLIRKGVTKVVGKVLGHADDAARVVSKTMNASRKAATKVVKAWGKGQGKKIGAEVLTGGAASTKAGRTGKQARLRQLGNDPKVSSADRGWIKQEINKGKRGGRKNLRNPPGKELAHKRGKEAAKGYSYEHSDLQNPDLHKLQHKYDKYGRKNK